MPDYDLGTARGRIDLDASSLGRASAAFGSLGKVMIGTGALLVGAFAYAVKSAADFEKIMSAVGAVSNATAAEMELMREVALDLGSSTVYGADQIGRAMEQLAKAGITIPEILGGATEAVVMLAAAAGDELAGGVDQAAVIMANAMKTFNVGADQAMHFADVLVAAAASSTLSVDDIATSLTYVGPAAASMGLSIDDLAASLAILGDRNIRGSTAGTSLRGVLLSLATQTPKATKVLKNLGIITEDGTNRFFDMNGALKPMPEVMQILGDATKDLSQQQRLSAFNAIFQRRAMNAAMILAEQGAAGFDKYARAIARLNASDIAAKKLDNLSGDVTLLKNAFETLMIRVGLPFQDMLRGWVQSLNDFVRELNTVNPELLAQIALYGAVAGAVAILAGSFLLSIGLIIRMYRNFIVLKEAIFLVWGAMKLLALSFLTNPIFLFIAALVAIGVALYYAYQQSEEFRERVDAALRALEPAFNAVKGFIENFVEQFGNLIEVISQGDDVAQGMAEVIDNMFGNTGKLVGPIRTLVEAIQQLDDVARAAFQYFADKVLPTLWDFAIVVGQTVGEAVSWFIDTGIPAVQRFADAVMRQIGMAMDWLSQNVVPIFTTLADFIVAAIDRIVRVIDFFAPYFEFAWARVFDVLQLAYQIISTVVENILILWGNFSDNIVRILTGAWDMVKQLVESALRIIQGVIQTFTGLISGDWERAWGGIQEIFSGVWSYMGDLLQIAWLLIWETLSAGMDLLISMWEIAWNTIGDALSAAWDLMVSLVTSAMDLFLAIITNTLNLVKDTFINVWDSIYSWFEPKIQAFVNIVSAVLDAIVGFFGGLWTRIVNALADIGQRAYDFFYNIMERANNGLAIGFLVVKDFVSRIPGKIIDALGDLGSLLFNAGKDIIQGLWNGMKDVWNGAKDWLGGLPGAIINLKGPPSYDRVMLVENGELIMRGLRQGMLNELPGLLDLVSAVAPAIEARVTASAGRAQAVSTLATPSVTAPQPTTITQEGDTYQIEKVEISARDLKEMNDVKDFFEKIEQVARQGVN